MGLILTVTAGLVVWIVLWALGARGFDAFMLATAIILLGASVVSSGFQSIGRLSLEVAPAYIQAVAGLVVFAIVFGYFVAFELLYLDVALDELWNRLSQRNSNLPAHTFPITRAQLDSWWALFEPPGPSELESPRDQ